MGKLLTPRRILNKRGGLTAQEREKVNLHTVNGAMLIYLHPQFHSVFMQKYAYEIALHHHERIDGRGYPDGLQGSELMPWTQIVSLADVYVALMEERPYRSAYQKDQAWSLIIKGACGTFDEKLLRCGTTHLVLRTRAKQRNPPGVDCNFFVLIIGQNTKTVNGRYNFDRIFAL